MAKKGSWEPREYTVRDPRTTTQQTGRILNPPRGQKFAGRGEAALLNTERRQRGTEGPKGIGPVSDRGRG